MRRRLVIIGGFGLALFLSVNTQLVLADGGNLVNNGGFETGDFSGWSASGNPSGCTNFPTGVLKLNQVIPACGGFSTFTNTTAPHSGTYAAFFGSPFPTSPGVINQDLATTPGGTYDLTFWLMNETGSTNSFIATFGSDTVLDLTNSDAFGWTKYTFDGLSAPTGDTPLTFTGYNLPSAWVLDDVSVTAASTGPPVPEPSALMLLISGVISLAALSLKKSVA
jgi:hypothetical protein